MKTALKNKFLRFLNLNQKDQGFTFIQLLIALIIVAFIHAIALPNLLGQISGTNSTEWKQAVDTINFGQQESYLGKEAFGLSKSEFGVALETGDFRRRTMKDSLKAKLLLFLQQKEQGFRFSDGLVIVFVFGLVYGVVRPNLLGQKRH